MSVSVHRVNHPNLEGFAVAAKRGDRTQVAVDAALSPRQTLAAILEVLTDREWDEFRAARNVRVFESLPAA